MKSGFLTALTFHGHGGQKPLRPSMPWMSLPQMPQAWRIVVFMGVAGCGKSTIGALLVARHAGAFYDADRFHPPANIAKMALGTPLDDLDRAPWLERLRVEVIDAAPAGGLSVLACSALKKSIGSGWGCLNPS